MRRLTKALTYTILFLILLLIALGLLALTLALDTSDAKIAAAFHEKNIPLTIGRFDFGGKSVRYMHTGDTAAQVAVIFVHGAPGSMDMFKATMMDSLMRGRVSMYAYDRLGYGGSDPGLPTTSLRTQADALLALIEQVVPQQRILLFSHSFGAPIAALAGADHPRVAEVVLAGGAVSPDHERFEWAAWLASSKLLRGMASADTRVSSAEKLTHVTELQQLTPIWKNFPKPVVVMHGTKDWLVPYANRDYLAAHLPVDRFIDKTLPGRSHFFFGDVPLLRSVILERLAE